MDKISLHNYEAYFLDFAEGHLTDAQIAALEAFLEIHPELRDELESFDPIALSESEPISIEWGDLKKPVLNDLQKDQTLRDTFFIRAIEGLLNDSENKILETLLGNKSFANEFVNWKKTILEENPDEKIIADSLFQFGLDRPIADYNYAAWLTAKTEGLLNAGQLEALTAFAKTKENGERDLKRADNLRLKPSKGIFYPDKSKLYKEENRKIVPLWIYRAAAIAAIFLFGIFIWNQLKTPINSDHPIAQKETEKPVSSSEIDSAKTETQSPSDTLKEEKPEKEPVLDEWQMREPDPVEYAERKAPESNRKRVNTKEMNPVSANETILISIDQDEPKLAILPTNHENEILDSGQPKQLAAKSTDFKTLPKLAEKALAQKLNVTEENQDQLANIVAQRITDKMSKMLDTEFKTESAQTDENNTISYTLRIGSFKFSRSKSR